MLYQQNTEYSEQANVEGWLYFNFSDIELSQLSISAAYSGNF
jgi:hypothetical protein